VVVFFWISFRDAFFGILDDRLLTNGVFGNILLYLGFVCFRGNVGLRGRQSCLLCRLVRRPGRTREYVFVDLRLCTLLDVIDLTAMLRSVVSFC
jgi:hypothetical protein